MRLSPVEATSSGDAGAIDAAALHVLSTSATSSTSSGYCVRQSPRAKWRCASLVLQSVPSSTVRYTSESLCLFLSMTYASMSSKLLSALKPVTGVTIVS